MTDTDGEVKSMHTLQTARRSGVGAAMLQRIMAEARALGLKRLYLETGSFEFFAPARALYTRHGFSRMRTVWRLQAGPEQHVHDAMEI